ncbi:MAG: hypothetical protein WCO29_11405 [Nostocales cyanobacterium ELA583]|jgi:hypothetical protein
MRDIFDNLNFQTLQQNPDFKEDSVREVIILPILKALGYTGTNIVRSKTLQHPFLKIGSKKRPINLIPDLNAAIIIKNRGTHGLKAQSMSS